jgi:hypothetical protein
MWPISRAQRVAYSGVWTKNHMNPMPITMSGNENDKVLSDSRMPEAVDLTLTMT